MTMSDDKDRAQAEAAGCAVHAGTLWRHYKGGLYYVREVAVAEDTLEILIVYQSIEKGFIWARTLANWAGFVDTDTEYVLPSGERRRGRPRFVPFKDKH